MSAESTPKPSDLILLNNSFVFRAPVRTKKSEKYLCVTLDGSLAPDLGSLRTAEVASFNLDFKRMRIGSSTVPTTAMIGEATKEELSRLGQLVFILIGSMDDTVVCRVDIKQGPFKELRFEPTASAYASIQGDVVVTSRLDDVETLWAEVEKQADADLTKDGRLPESMVGSFADAFERLQAEAHSELRLPDATIRSLDETLLGSICRTTSEQIRAYEGAVAELNKASGGEARAYAEVLRIAHNFAGDAAKLIRLVVSVCDLKPILMWCTIGEHLNLAESFRLLPWLKSKNKASVERYSETIARARNRAFHDFIPFDRSVQVELGGVDVKATRLLLFPPYSKKGSAGVEYEDQEIVELLTDFTRAPQTSVPLTFWRRNTEVMRSLERLLRATGEALLSLRRAAG
jgi:hypothetical protein